jgi:formylglycine-generating enzyme required for sulfatase activity
MWIYPQRPRSATSIASIVRSGVVVVCAATGCAKPAEGTAASTGPSATATSAPPLASVRKPKEEAKPDARAKIPGGVFRAGSRPGDPGRRPDLEPVLHDLELGPFEIDRLPYPNDPTLPPKTGVSRDMAKRLCAEKGARLCTELEWERACKGPASESFATGAAWDPRCKDEARSCATGFDALGMGALREWTASDVVPTDDGSTRRAATRGAASKAPVHDHRCAARNGIDAATSSEDLGFRCCHGPPNAAVIKEAVLGQTFERAKISAEDLEKLLAADPRTASLAKDVKFFREPDSANAVVERGTKDKKGFLFTVAPLLWNPVAGAQYLLVSARSGDSTSFVAAFHVAGKDEYLLASSFVMKNEPGPVAFAYSGYIRPRLHFSTCWGCPGETGKLLHRDPDAVVIVQP